jgi:hypothetical protein
MYIQIKTDIKQTMYIYKQIQLPLFDKKQYYVLYVLTNVNLIFALLMIAL